jgi:two-component system response regulator YesN
MKKRDIFEEIVEYILSRPDDEFQSLNVDSIARTYNISRSYLSYKFKQEMQQPLSNYILKVKIIRSTLLMYRDDKIKIESLSALMGFSRTDYFIKIFKKIMGISPGRYQKIIKQLKSQDLLDFP